MASPLLGQVHAIIVSALVLHSSATCILPADTTGYDTSMCFATSPTDSCPSDGGTFQFSGCRQLPTCTLPPSTTGYVTTGCDTSSAALTTDACTVTCATNYRGSGYASCSTDGGTFSLGGCEAACTLPSASADLAPYYTGGCGGTRSASQCALSCATGYQGTAVATCSAAGGTHVLSGCTAKPTCSLPSSTTGYSTGSCAATTASQLNEDQCSVSCATNYRGTAIDSCSLSGGTFAFTGCEAACTLPSASADLAPYYTGGCGGTRSASQCALSCATGYQGTAAATCSAAGGTHVLSGCTAKPTCSLPSSSMGYSTGSCAATTASQLNEDQCSVSCATNYRGTAIDSCSSSGGTFSFSGCEAACTLPTASADLAPYYTGGCGGTRSASQCSLSCATGYQGTASATCSTAGGTHVLSGCTAKPTCSLPATTTGYSTGSCAATAASPLNEDQCSVSCATGSAGSAMDSCSSSGGTFSFSGCEAACTLPTASADLAPYYTGGCGGTRSASQCTLSCATGYRGTAVATCSTAGGTHVLSGCTAMPTCSLPATTTGYITTGSCAATTASPLNEDQCSVSCATGYDGGPKATSQCPVSCGAGYEGTVTVDCSNSVFSLSGCSATPDAGTADFAVHGAESAKSILLAAMFVLGAASHYSS